MAVFLDFFGMKLIFAMWFVLYGIKILHFTIVWYTQCCCVQCIIKFYENRQIKDKQQYAHIVSWKLVIGTTK